MNIKQIIYNLKWYNFEIYTQPYELNIVGLRNSANIPNTFNDLLFVFWYDDNKKLQYEQYSISTDPGTFFLKNPMGSDGLGTAILKQGQYKKSYKLQQTYRLGAAYNAYELVQILPVTIVRDYNRDAILDFYNGRETSGLYGINIHTGAIVNGESIDVEEWSAGCQVFKKYEDWKSFIILCQKHEKLGYGNFTYTLLDQRSLKRAYKRYGTYAIATAITLGVSYGLYQIFKK